MDATVGDRIIVESERVGQPAREGTILAIEDSPGGRSFQVRWEDGHESSIRPSAGSARILPAAGPARRATNSPAPKG